MPRVYTLTEVIGRRAGADRTTEVLTFEMTRRAFWGALAGAGAGVFLGAILSPFMQAWALVMIPLGIAVGVWAVTFRSSEGMRLRPYERLVVKRKSLTGQVLYCGKPFNPYLAHPCTVIEARETRPSVVLMRYKWKQI